MDIVESPVFPSITMVLLRVRSAHSVAVLVSETLSLFLMPLLRS